MLLSWIFTYFWDLLDVSLVWYNACLIDWFLLTLIIWLEDALAQPFRFFCSNLFLIKMPWYRSPLLNFMVHFMPFCLCLQLSATSNVCLSTLWYFLKHSLCYGFLVLEVIYVINVVCHLILTCGIWYLISMFLYHFCLTWCLFPFRGMFRFHPVHLFLPSLSFVLVWYLCVDYRSSMCDYSMYKLLTSLV